MKIKPYPKYKQSGVDWVGTVPQGWQLLPLFTVLHERRTKNEGNRIQNVLSLSYGRIVDRDVESNHGLLPESFETYQIVESDDIVLRLTDLQNDKRSLRVGQVCRKGIITSAYTSLIPSERIDPIYAYLLLHAYDTMKIFYGLGGGVRQSMKFDDLKWLLLPMPPKEEQAAIATFLDRETAKIDNLIAKQEKLIELLKEKRQAVISQAVINGLDPTVPLKPSGIEWLGDVPKHWQRTKLSHITTKIGDGLHGTPSYVDQSIFYFVNGNNLVDGEIKVFEATKCVSQEEYEIQSIELNDSTLLLSINGTIGNLAYYKWEPVMLGKSAAYINCSNRLRRSYLYYFLKSSQVRKFFDTEVTGTTIHNLSLESVRNLPIVLPSAQEQHAIADFLDQATTKLNTLIAKAELAIALQKEHRATLIFAAVTGKIDVRQAASELQEAA